MNRDGTASEQAFAEWIVANRALTRAVKEVRDTLGAGQHPTAHQLALVDIWWAIGSGAQERLLEASRELAVSAGISQVEPPPESSS